MAGFLINTPDAEKFAPKYFTDSNLVIPFSRLISQAEAQALASTPLDLIVAPAAGYFISPITQLMMSFDYNGTAWSADVVNVYFSTLTKAAPIYQLLKADFQGTADFVKGYSPSATNLAIADKISIEADTDFTNNGSPFRISFLYRIMPIG